MRAQDSQLLALRELALAHSLNEAEGREVRRRNES